MKYKLLALFMALAIAPAFGQSRSHATTGSHMRPQLFHDRSPRIHSRAAQPHHQS